MPDEILFCIADPTGKYTARHIGFILREAERLGHPLDKDSYLERMTVRQLDALVHGRTDA